MSLGGFLSGSAHSAKRLCKFEIRPDADFVVLRGPEGETPDVLLRGNVVLMTSEPIQAKGIKVILEGKRRTMHFISTIERVTAPPAQSPIINKMTFLTMECRLEQDGHAIKMVKPGNHIFPFEFKLKGDIPESIEGLPGNNFISYDLKAVIEKGVLAKDMTAHKHIRVIRTPGDDPLEFIDAQDVHGFWPDKLKYQFTTASRAAIFGDSLVTEIELTPLVEKLRIGKITTTLREIRKTKTIPGPDFSPENGWGGMWKKESDVASQTMTVPEGSEDTDPDLSLPMFKFKSIFKLPESLNECRQSVEYNDWIRIKHMVVYSVILHNPDGHMSELKAHHSVRIFISPNLPVGEDNRVAHASGPEAALPHDQTLLGDMQSAPPLYGEHRLDRIYEGIDPNDFLTPGFLSGVATPFNGITHNASTENLSTLSHAAHSSALDSRLRNLQLNDADSHPLSRPMIPQRRSSQENAEASSDHGTSFTNGYTIDNSGLHDSPPQPAYDMEALERKPSYATAIRTPVPLSTSEPPTYALATSRPPSPVMQVPGRAHLRSGHNTPPRF